MGRNDGYEPNWVANLETLLAYNSRLCSAEKLEYRVAFVEWNPPASEPLIAPRLVEKFPFVRGIIVEPGVHAALCETNDLDVMLNFSYNAALRTSNADYTLITGGDIFFTRAIARRMAQGLRPGVFYRAERVNIRADLPFSEMTPEELELPEHVTSVDSCTIPPNDVPPYTMASGDFLMLDTGTMRGMRGMDEEIRSARLHLDSRFCRTAMVVTDSCELLGQILHIEHHNSFRKQGGAKGRPYTWNAGLPYANPDSWGLADFAWLPLGPALWRIVPRRGTSEAAPIVDLSPQCERHAASITAKLQEIRRSQRPQRPPADVTSAALASCRLGTGAGVQTIPDDRGLRVCTRPIQWSPAIVLSYEIGEALENDRWYWAVLRLIVSTGSVVVSLAPDMPEDYYALQSIEPIDIAVPIATKTGQIAIRNAAPDGASSTFLMQSLNFVSSESRATSAQLSA